MREIKFRAWDTEENQFVTHSRVIESNILALEQNGQGRLVFQQYIGLKDKKGVEVYEGDITECFAFGLTTVVFEDGGFGLYSKYQGFFPFSDIYGRVTVVGNIHEHPHLLERSGE